MPKIHTVIKEEKDKLLQLENKIVNNNERLRILCSIFSQAIPYYNLKSDKRSTIKRFDYTTRRDYISIQCGYKNAKLHLQW